jgi:2-polyprenyl-6-methoxyphenol hydroxylase-like FAD-dependent oxidoreductase
LSRAAPSCDVAVIGAGPAGAACALALRQAKVASVVLVDGGRPAGPAIGETIPPDARLLLDRLGLWQAFLEEGHEPCLGSSSAWGNATLGYNDFLLNPQGSGWHLDRARFDDFLRRHARAAGASSLESARFVAAEDGGGDGYRLRLSGGRMLDARFVVDASGRASAFARHVGARQTPLDRLSFVYGFFDTAAARSHSRLTLLEAVPQGWWYAAALPGGRLAVAFAGDAEAVRAGGLGQDGRWLDAALATRHLAARLEGCVFIPGSLAPRVAASFLLDRVQGPRWLAAGDAAACFDPLAAQGIYKALEDGLEGAALIAAALRDGGDLAGGYAETARARFDDYLVNRNYFYGLERRWPDSGFWRRRQGRAELSAAA